LHVYKLWGGRWFGALGLTFFEIQLQSLGLHGTICAGMLPILCSIILYELEKGFVFWSRYEEVRDVKEGNIESKKG